MNCKKTSDVFMWLSAVLVIISGFVSLTQINLFKLAGTQWMLIAIISGIYGVYAKMMVKK